MCGHECVDHQAIQEVGQCKPARGVGGGQVRGNNASSALGSAYRCDQDSFPSGGRWSRNSVRPQNFHPGSVESKPCADGKSRTVQGASLSSALTSSGKTSCSHRQFSFPTKNTSATVKGTPALTTKSRSSHESLYVHTKPTSFNESQTLVSNLSKSSPPMKTTVLARFRLATLREMGRGGKRRQVLAFDRRTARGSLSQGCLASSTGLRDVGQDHALASTAGRCKKKADWLEVCCVHCVVGDSCTKWFCDN